MPAEDDKPSIAVLPFQNMSGDPDQDYFADGITDALINDLSRIESLRVMSRTAVMKYKRASQSPAEIGRDLTVEGILMGSVARTGDRVRVNLQLIHVPTARSLWTKDFDREVRDMLTLQGEVRSEIAKSIGLSPPVEQNAAARSVNPEAYDQYVRGEFYLYRQKKDENAIAIDALERAVAVDPAAAAALRRNLLLAGERDQRERQPQRADPQVEHRELARVPLAPHQVDERHREARQERGQADADSGRKPKRLRCEPARLDLLARMRAAVTK